MALVQCRVCGSQTSDQEEICIICGYSWQGRSRDRWWKGLSLVLAFIFLLFLLLSIF